MTVLISIFGPPRSYYQPCRAIFRENWSAWLIRLLAGQIIEIIQPWLIKQNLPSHVRMRNCSSQLLNLRNWSGTNCDRRRIQNLLLSANRVRVQSPVAADQRRVEVSLSPCINVGVVIIIIIIAAPEDKVIFISFGCVCNPRCAINPSVRPLSRTSGL